MRHTRKELMEIGRAYIAGIQAKGPVPAPEQNPEDYGLPPYPTGEVVGPCVCGSWPGGKCLKCRINTGEAA